MKRTEHLKQPLGVRVRAAKVSHISHVESGVLDKRASERHALRQGRRIRTRLSRGVLDISL
jgi:hypothetical protein